MTFQSPNQRDSAFSRDASLESIDHTYRGTIATPPTAQEYAYSEGDPVINIPLSVFYSTASTLQIIVRYLHDTRKVDLHAIARLLHRDYNTIWTTYTHSPKDAPLNDAPSRIEIPLSIFHNRTCGPLENLVVYLKGFDLRFSEIADLLNKNERTIWTTYHRAKKKGVSP
jgi:hypothetical protein